MEMKYVNKIYRCVPLPMGYMVSGCPYCGCEHLSGALVSEYADEQDPDVVCVKCGKIIDKLIY